MLRQVIGDNVKACRKDSRLSQQEVADKSGMEQKDISKIENYLENIGVDKLDQVSKGLGRHPYELVIEIDEISGKDLLEKNFFAKGMVYVLHEYYLLLSKSCIEGFGAKPVETYGIGVEDESVPCIRNICTDRAFVESLVSLCNTCQVSPEHLQSVVDDALFERQL